MAGNIQYVVSVDERGAVTSMDKFAGSAEAAGQKASTALGGFQQRIKDNAMHIRAAGIAITAFGAIVTGAMGLAVHEAAAFQLGITNVTNQLGGEGKQFTKEFSEGIRGMAEQFGLSKELLTRSLFDIVSSGIDAGKSMEFLGVSSKLSVAGLASIDTTTSALLTVMAAYGKEVKDTADASDYLFTVAKIGRTTLEQLAAGFGTVGPVAALAGLSMNDLGAAIAQTTLAGISTDEVMTALRALLNSFVDPTKEAKAAAAELGIELNSNALRGTNFVETLKKMQGASIEQATAIAGSTRALKALAPITQDVAKFEELRLQIVGRAGTVDAAQIEISKTFSKQYEILQEKIKNVVEGIGVALIPAVQKLIGVVIPAIEWIASFAQKHEKLAAVVLTGVGVLGALALVLGPLLIMLPGIVSAVTLLTPAWIALTGAVMGTNGALVLFAIKAAPILGAAGLIAIGAIAIWKIADATWEWYKAEQAKQDITDQSDVSTFRAAEMLRRYGIIIERGSMTIDEYAVAIGKANAKRVQEQREAVLAATAIAKHSEEVKKAIPLTDAQKEALKALAEFQKKVREEYDKSLRPANELNKSLIVLRNTGVSNYDMLRVYGDQIVDVAMKQMMLGESVSGLTRELFLQRAEGLRLDLPAWTEELKKIKIANENVAASIPPITIGYSDLKDALKDNIELEASLAALQADAANSRVEEYVKESEAANDFGKEVSTVFTNMAQGIAKAIIEWKSLADVFKSTAKSIGEAILSHIIERAIKPLLNWIDSLFNTLEQKIRGLGGSVGGLGSALAGSLATLGIGTGLSLIQPGGGVGRGAVGGAMVGVGGLMAAGGIAAAVGGAGFGAGAMAGLGALGGPLGLGIAGLAVAIGALVGSLGRGRKEADTLVPMQNDLTTMVQGIAAELDKLRAAGELTPEILENARTQIEAAYNDFIQFTQQFGRAGPGARQTMKWVEEFMDSLSSEIPAVQLAAIGAELTSLSIALETLEDALVVAQTKERIDELEKELGKLDTQISASTQLLSRYNEELINVNATLDDLKKQLGVAILKEQLASLQDQLSKSTIALSGYQKEMDDLNSVLGSASSAQLSYADAIRQASAESQRAAAAVVSAQNQIASLEQQVAIDQLQTIIDTGDKESSVVKQAQADMAALRLQITLVDRAARAALLDQLKADLPKLQAAAEAAEAAEKAARQAGMDRVIQLGSLIVAEKALQDVLNNKITALEKLLPLQQSEVERIQSAIIAAEARKIVLQDLISVETAALIPLIARRDAIQNEIAELQKLLPVRVAESVAIQQTISLINERTAALIAERDALMGGVGPAGISDIPQLQHGGITTRQTLAMLHPNEAVIPLDRSSGGGLSNMTVNVTFAPRIMTGDRAQFSRMVRDELLPEIERAWDGNARGSRARLRETTR